MQQKRRPCCGMWRVGFFLLLLTPTTASAGMRALPVVHKATPQAVKIWQPTTITGKKGDTVKLKLINKTEHEPGYRIADFTIEKIVQGGQAETVEFTADKKGIFTIDCQLASRARAGTAYRPTVACDAIFKYFLFLALYSAFLAHASAKEDKKGLEMLRTIAVSNQKN